MMNKDFNEFKDQITGLWSKGDYHSMQSAMQKLRNAYGKLNLTVALGSCGYEERDEMLHDIKKGIQAEWRDLQGSMTDSEDSDINGNLDSISSSAKLYSKISNSTTPIWDVSHSEKDIHVLRAQQLAPVLDKLEHHHASVSAMQQVISDVWNEKGDYQGVKVISEAFDEVNDTTDFADECNIELDAHERTDAIQFLVEPLQANLSAITGEDPDAQYNAEDLIDISQRLGRMLKGSTMFYLYPEDDGDNEADLQNPKPMTKHDLLYLAYDLAYGDEDIDIDAWVKNIKAINK